MRRGARIVLVTALIIALVVVISSFVTLNEYAITPGQAVSVIPLISVDKGHTQHHKGSVLLTDVQIVPLRAIDYLYYKLNSNDEVLPKSVVIGTLSAAQYNTQGVIDMATARQAATVVAFRALGYQTTARPTGVVDYAPSSPDAPATGALSVGDVITAVDGHPTLASADLEGVLGALAPGDAVKLALHAFSQTKPKSVTVTLGAARSTPVGELCVKANAHSTLPYVLRSGRRVPCLGIETAQLLATVGAPFPVSMNAEGIIGPSAGLAFTLGLIEKLGRADLTGGKKIAATGTIAIDGTVGDVGGVAQKTVAVRNAGATVFFVPTQELAVARAHAGPTLQVFAVANVTQAIADLEHLGGKVVRPVAG
jgi:PDZ domain-containing protein